MKDECYDGCSINILFGYKKKEKERVLAISLTSKSSEKNISCVVELTLPKYFL